MSGNKRPIDGFSVGIWLLILMLVAVLVYLVFFTSVPAIGIYCTDVICAGRA